MGKRRPTTKGCQAPLAPSRNPLHCLPQLCSPSEREHFASPLCGLGQPLALSGPLCPFLGPSIGALARLRQSLHTPQQPALLAGTEPAEPLAGKAWGPSQLDTRLILSKDAAPQGGGRLSPDIKGPPPLALLWEPCKVIGNRRMTLCPSPTRTTWEKEKKKLLAALYTGFG